MIIDELIAEILKNKKAHNTAGQYPNTNDGVAVQTIDKNILIELLNKSDLQEYQKEQIKDTVISFPRWGGYVHYTASAHGVYEIIDLLIKFKGINNG